MSPSLVSYPHAVNLALEFDPCLLPVPEMGDRHCRGTMKKESVFRSLGVILYKKINGVIILILFDLKSEVISPSVSLKVTIRQQ